MIISGWNFYRIIFVCLLSGYLLVGTESIFPKFQPVYTDSFLPAGIQVTQHLIDKINELVENPPDIVTGVLTASALTGSSPAVTTVSPPSPTTTNVSLATANISLTNIHSLTATINSSPTTTNILFTTTNVSQKTTNTSPIITASVSTTLTTEMPSFQDMKQTSQLENGEYLLETETRTESISVSVTNDDINSQNTDSCLLSVFAKSEHLIYTSDAASNREYTVFNGTVNESSIKQNVTDKVDIITNDSTHKNETVQHMTATIVLTRLRDILAIEAKRQGMSKIQGYSTKLLKLLAPTSKMSSSDQLSFILKNMLKNRNVKRRESIAQSRIVLENLSKRHSILSAVLTHIPPFQYT